MTESAAGPHATSDIESGVPVAAGNVYPLRTGILGGLVAGAVMALAMALWGAISGNGIWYPVNLIAATFLPNLQTATPAVISAFDPAGALLGTVMHFGISAVLGLFFALILPTLPGSTTLWALIVGPLLWIGAQYAALPVINPRMEDLVSEPTFLVAHLAYSLVLGLWIARQDKIRLPDWM